MTTDATLGLTISHDHTAKTGLAHVIEFSPRERTARALKAWGGLTLAGVVAIFIPIAHFFLVPGFVIAGIVMGIKRLRTTREFIRASGECPKCNNAIELPLEASQHFPKWDYCPHCRASLKLSEE